MYRAFLRAFASVFFCCVTVTTWAEQATIRFYSEVAAPFYWLDANGEPQGASVDLANAISALTGIQSTVESMAWARAYYEATHRPNIVLTSVLKTPARESEFQWLGLVHVARASFIGLKARQNIQLANVDDARRYRVGTVRGYGAANYLLKQGFVEKQNLILATNTEQLWSLLYSGRIDLALSNLETDRFEISDAGFDPALVTAHFNVDELNLQIQMATGLTTPAATASAISDALSELKQNGEYTRIMTKWGLL